MSASEKASSALGPNLIFRPACLDDAARLLAWRNDPITRAQSRNTDLVSSSEHHAWLVSVLADPSRRLFIVEDETGVAVGTVRFDHALNETELSWAVAPDARGRGLGKIMVTQALAQIAGVAVACIRPGNAASLAIARAAGFSPAGMRGEMTLWKRA